MENQQPENDRDVSAQNGVEFAVRKKGKLNAELCSKPIRIISHLHMRAQAHIHLFVYTVVLYYVISYYIP